MDFASGHLDLTYYEGLSHVHLLDPQAAAEAFKAALTALPQRRVKARAILMLSLAIAFAQAEQLDQATDEAARALAIAGDQPIRRVRQRAEDLRRMLGPGTRSVAVRDFEERLAAFQSELERTAGPSS